jgi:transposase
LPKVMRYNADMASRGQAVHVATTRREYNGKVYETHLLRRTYREGGKVKHQTLGNISHLPPEVIELIRGALRGETYVRVGAGLSAVRSLPHGHVKAVLGTLRKIGLDEMIASRRSRERDLAVAMVVARLLSPASKLATAQSVSRETAVSTLGQELGVEEVDADELYDAMDWLVARQTRIEKKLGARHLGNGSLVLYDVSGSYYTGTHCPLAQYGYPRDGKKKFPQIVYGLLCTSEGCPVGVDVFSGDTADSMTLSAQIAKVRKRWGLKRVVLVGDRGLLTTARIEEEMKPAGLDWITALRAPAIRKLADDGAVQLSLFDERDLAEVYSPDYPGERLIACRNPLLAEDRARTRKELLQATERELEKIVLRTQRPKRPLRGKDKIGVAVGKVVNRYKMGKHFLLEITERGFTYRRDEARICNEAALDGLYVIRTSVGKGEFAPEGAVRAYKDLALVERAFRCLKGVDLRVRPVGHRRERRVRAHVLLCMLAYYVEWHMRRALAPLLFSEEQKEVAETLRTSVVAPARRSPAAQRKASRKKADGGYPLHSFRGLVQNLGTIVRNTMRTTSPSGHVAEFPLVTEPTPLQQEVLRLLGVRLAP